jgi:HD-GYP domain-containing protein (c-di-GMP phosphodiesterase class II)
MWLWLRPFLGTHGAMAVRTRARVTDPGRAGSNGVSGIAQAAVEPVAPGRGAILAQSIVDSGYSQIVLDRLVKQTCEVMDADQSSIVVRDRFRPPTAIVVAAHGAEEDMVGSRVGRGEGIAGRVLELGRPIAVNPKGATSTPTRRREAARAGARAAAPIAWSGRVWGALAAATTESRRRFARREVRTLCELADAAAGALAQAESHEDSLMSVRELLDAGAAGLDSRDGYTARHSEEVLALARVVGEHLGLERAALIELELSALLHDLGKLGVPEAILRKPGPLRGEQREVINRHPAQGAELLKAIPGLEAVATIVRFHHERWDGGGYPDGLRAHRIPLTSRIIAACDAYHAMTSDRPYRGALPPEHAMRELHASAGAQFDPRVVDALLQVLTSNKRTNTTKGRAHDA